MIIFAGPVVKQSFSLLVIADVHYAPGRPDAGGMRVALGKELLRRAIDDAGRRGGLDAIALTGDLLNEPEATDAEGTLLELRAEAAEAAGDAPLLLAPGNHDGDPARALATFGLEAGPREIKDYRFFVFADSFAPGDFAARSRADRQAFREFAAGPGGPLVAIQHNPIHPDVPETEYPYMLTNRREVMHDYSEAGALLSISGHYHAGQALSTSGGVRYFTAPALCEPPFHYTMVTLTGRQVYVEPRRLTLDEPPALTDTHAHTQFAYCAAGVTAEGNIQRARTFGLGGIVLVEHAPHLYCTLDDFCAARHVRQPHVWRSDENVRMPQFRREILPLADDFVRVGLEVELDCDGELTLQDADRDCPWVLAGAIHWLPEGLEATGGKTFAKAFARTTERLLAAGVDILAHPFRIFGGRFERQRRALYEPVADMLAATRTAAEINFHINSPDPAFFAACIERGVKIAFGSDAHRPRDVAALGAHLQMLREIAGARDVGELLWR